MNANENCELQQTSDNKSGLLDLANRMERLQPVFSCMQDVKGNSAVSVPLFESLKMWVSYNVRLDVPC